MNGAVYGAVLGKNLLLSVRALRMEHGWIYFFIMETAEYNNFLPQAFLITVHKYMHTICKITWLLWEITCCLFC